MRRILAAGAPTALGMFGGLALPASVAAAATSANLIVNPDAETGTCTTSRYHAMALPGWAVTNGAADASAGLSQAISVSGYSGQVDTGTYGYRLSGWLGGYRTQDDNARVTATFRDSASDTLGTASLAPVLSAQGRAASCYSSISAAPQAPTTTGTPMT